MTTTLAFKSLQNAVSTLSPLETRDSPALTYDATVNRRLVHRSSIAEVFLTDAEQLDEGRFVVAGQLPRGHSMVESDHYDFNILLEFIRQAGVFVTHRYFDVPVGASSFLFRDLSIELTPESLRIGTTSAEVVAYIDATATRTRHGEIKSVAFRDDVRIEGRPLLVGEGSHMVLNPSTWGAVRSRGRAQALTLGQVVSGTYVKAAPVSVGRINPRNVVVTNPTVGHDQTMNAWLVVDQGHPYLFDHHLDHIPGNLILEGARQTAVGSLATAYGISADALFVRTCRGNFGSFGELDLATRLVARVAALHYDNVAGQAMCPVHVTALQGTREIATIELTLGVNP